MQRRSQANFSRYIKFLPEELLPTFWTEAERDLLTGTSLKPAIEAKIKSLTKEFDQLRSATEHIKWCAELLWDEEDGIISFDDWLQVDAMYRSRALEFPGIGDSMVPCVDMANHASGDATVALYETDSDGNAALLLRDGKELKKGDEITITSVVTGTVIFCNSADVGPDTEIRKARVRCSSLTASLRTA